MSRDCRENRLRLTALLAIALCSVGCSLGMSTAPSHPSARTEEAARECTSSPHLPILDTLSAGVGAFNVAISAAAEDEVTFYGAAIDKEVGLTLGITQLALFGAGAVYGYVQLGRCHALRKERHLTSGEGHARRDRNPRSPPLEGGSAVADVPPPAEPPSELPSWSAFRRVHLSPSARSRTPHGMSRPATWQERRELAPFTIPSRIPIMIYKSAQVLAVDEDGYATAVATVLEAELGGRGIRGEIVDMSGPPRLPRIELAFWNVGDAERGANVMTVDAAFVTVAGEVAFIGRVTGRGDPNAAGDLAGAAEVAGRAIADAMTGD